MAKTNEEKAEEITWKLFDDGLSFYNYMAQRQKIQSAIMKMAQWKDEQFKAERQALIDKACEWLEYYLSFDVMSFDKGVSVDTIVSDFKQAMKGGEE